MSINIRKASRNVHVWSGGPDGVEIAGFWQHGYVTVNCFREWIDLCLEFKEEDKNGTLGITKDWGLFKVSRGRASSEQYLVDRLDLTMEDIMPIGEFVILHQSSFKSLHYTNTSKRYRPRTISGNLSSTSKRTNHFADRIRERDGLCCVSGVTVEDEGGWETLKAAHIFARAHLDRWRQEKFENLIKDDYENVGDAKIDSIQNGLLLRSHHHDAFDAHKYAINPRDDYKIFDFRKSGELNGKKLIITEELGSPYRPLDELLLDHFEQAVMKNIRGAAEIYDQDADDDWTNPDTLRMDNEALVFTTMGRLRLETELGNRLNHLVSS